MQSTTPVILTPVSQKIEKAFHLLLQSGFDKWSTVEEFTEAVKKMGGVSVELLAKATWEDFESGLGVPRLIAKGLADVFRSKDKTVAEGREEVLTIKAHKPMTDWPVEMVVADLDPTKPNSPESKELARRFGARPILVFDANGVFDFTGTCRMIERAERDEPETDLYSYPNGVVVTVYAVGFGPFRLKDACPFHPDTPLIDGRCYKCQAEWGGFAKDVRQVIFYVGQSGFIRGDNRAQVHELFGRMVSASGPADQMSWLGTMYPEAMKEYREAKAHGTVVPLTLDLGTNGKAKRDDPFGKNRQF